MCILDLSKTFMYDFHYNYIKQKYGNKAKLLRTDTNSLIYNTETEDVYKNFWNDKDNFDNSDYPDESSFYVKTNTELISKFKDGACGTPIKEFVGLRSKMYSYIKDNNQNNKTAKEIKKTVIKKDIQLEDYKKTLFHNEQMYHTMKIIRSINHQPGSYQLNKVSLSYFMISVTFLKIVYRLCLWALYICYKTKFDEIIRLSERLGMKSTVTSCSYEAI